MKHLNSKKSISDISKEWDAVCRKRAEVIQRGDDFSLLGVNIPCILKYLEKCNKSNVLDIGCGSGYLTNLLAEKCENVVGIDASSCSIDIAQELYQKDNLMFRAVSLEEYLPSCSFDTCIANMVLMTDPKAEESIRIVYNLLKPGGHFLFTITHPCFWPKYWGYDNKEWFDYSKEVFIENEFSTSLSDSMGVTTHIHRPLNMYMNFFIKSGFHIEILDEPYPVLKIPEGYQYSYPRFLFGMFRK